jgi:MFS transporter, DHA2 family, multidrug resistance protein
MSQSDSPMMRAVVTVTIMLATILQALDSTIAAVALPDMQGTFSATQDQVSWVLTSYIVAAAIMTPMAGYLGDRIGRKNLYLIAVGGFVLTSMACGLATSIEGMVVFRFLQGCFGAPLVPIAQATMLDTYPPEKTGSAMAMFGMGVMLGPILGPSLGAYLTEYYNWRWVFFINVPLGVIALFGIQAAIKDPVHRDRDRPFDMMGFALLSIAIGAMQLMLDRGNTLLWFQSKEIVIEGMLAAICFYMFLVHVLTKDRPFIEPKMFKDRNFSGGMIFMFVAGLNMLATMALMPPFLQHLLGYPVLTTGYVLAPRGLGTMVSMFIVGRIVNKVDARLLLLIGLLISAWSLWDMSNFTTDVSFARLVWIGVLQGIGMGFLFTPVSVLAFSTLPPQYRTEGSGIFALSRNLGSAIGVSILTGMLARYIQINRAWLVEHVTPFSDAMQSHAVTTYMNPGTLHGLSVLDGTVVREAMMLGYADDFRAMTLFTLIAIPMLLLLKPPPRASARPAPSQQPVLE